MGGRQRAKMNIPMCAACVLLCLTLFSCYLCGGLFAKYTTSGAGDDSARVITFGDLTLKEEGDFVEKDGKNNFIVTPGVGLRKDVELSFTGSEAATYIFVEVETEYTTADNYTFTYESGEKTMLQWSVVKKTDSDPEGWTFLSGTDGKYVYYRELEPNVSFSGVDIIAGPVVDSDVDGQVLVNATTKSDIASLKGKNISIVLRAVAVQAGGFENAEKAWESVAGK
ncbi:MAG: hypothetical protein IKM46_00735 [Clostridia bacterium]|nr:hypothetical protein [Clostridia bacterium]